MSPYFIKSVNFQGDFVHIVIGDCNDEYYSLELKLTADDLKKAFDK